MIVWEVSFVKKSLDATPLSSEITTSFIVCVGAVISTWNVIEGDLSLLFPDNSSNSKDTVWFPWESVLSKFIVTISVSVAKTSYDLINISLSYIFTKSPTSISSGSFTLNTGVASLVSEPSTIAFSSKGSVLSTIINPPFWVGFKSAVADSSKGSVKSVIASYVYDWVEEYTSFPAVSITLNMIFLLEPDSKSTFATAVIFVRSVEFSIASTHDTPPSTETYTFSSFSNTLSNLIVIFWFWVLVTKSSLLLPVSDEILKSDSVISAATLSSVYAKSLTSLE